MIMDRVPGGPFQEQFLKASWLKKGVIVRNIIAYFVQLFEKRFHELGNLYTMTDLQQLTTKDIPDTKLLGSDSSSTDNGFCLSEIVSYSFFSDTHLRANIPQDPFKSSHDWLAARIQLHIYDIDHPRLTDADSDDSEEEDEDLNSEITIMNSPLAIKSCARRLLALLPTFFPNRNTFEEFVLHHHDLNANNILVDASHKLTGIIDWERISTLPLWLACDIPKFLIDTARSNPETP
jgi:hypothetical protein